MPGFLRRIIKICAEDSPNVRWAREQQSRGKQPSGEVVLMGVIGWDEYQKRRKLWDATRQMISLDAEFPDTADILLYPPAWIIRAETLHRLLSRAGVQRSAQAIGIDPAEGGDKTVYTVIDRLGIMYQEGSKTMDTAIITGRTLALMQQYRVPAERVMFDRGGGGKQHADRMRQQGHNVQTVGFGETVQDPERYKRFHQNLKNNAIRQDDLEERYVYKNRRAEMYDSLSKMLDPTQLPQDIREITPENEGAILSAIRRGDHVGFAIPPELEELRRQMAPLPRLYDQEGRMYMLAKDRPNKKSEERGEPTLKELLGCSPDEVDSTVLAVFGMISRPLTRVLKAV